MSKRKATSQGRRSRRMPTFDVVASSDEDRPNTYGASSTGVERHIHRLWTPSENRREILGRTAAFTTPASPSKARTSLNQLTEEEDGTNYDLADVEPLAAGGQDPHYVWRVEEREVESTKKKRKKYASDQPLKQWIPTRPEYLDELLRLEGRAQFLGVDLCPTCKIVGRDPAYRCRDCFGGELFCQHCVVSSHLKNPLHRIDKWVGSHFERTTLRELGLTVQLGHGGHVCPHAQLWSAPGEKEFVVFDTHSIQRISLSYCGCPHAPSHTTQLLRERWYPATVVYPSTAVTFAALGHFHLNTLQSKQSAYDYYSAVERETDNTELKTPPDRYEAFLRMVREWRHLKQLKRFARGHSPDGLEKTSEGDLVLACPACPQAGVNLPEDWEDAPEEKRWLYCLILAIDANFRLRRKNVSSDDADPALGSGWGYFVENVAYKLHLRNYGNQEDVSSCSNFSATTGANRKTRGLATTGVAACVCARHQLLRGNGVADLQHGERYCNIDYIFFSTLRGERLRHLIASYDVSCQWYKNLWTRMAALPSEFHLDLSKILVRFLIPKFHLPAHIEPCQSLFSLNYTLGVGRTDGEGVERDWAMINPVAYSTREMTPGHRADTLDDHWGDWNWKKVSGMGRALARRMKAAVPERITHVAAFREMCRTLPQARVEEWQVAVKVWEREMAIKLPRDVSVPNPYDLKHAAITQAKVRLQLAEEEAARVSEGSISMHDVSPGQFITIGLDIEEHQHRIRDDRKALLDGTSAQRASLQERRNIMRRKIEAWYTIQAVYMPGAAGYRARLDRRLQGVQNPPPYAGESENMDLLLPSEVKSLSHEIAVVESGKLIEIEARLREAQASDALQELRHYLQMLSFLWKDKDKHSRGQRENTRSQTLIKRAGEKKNRSVRRYHRAYRALIKLVPGGGWSNSLKELRDKDVRALGEGEGGASEGRRTISWIWTVAGVGTGGEADDVALHDSLRVEWAKARARSERWTEEVELLREEMRRVEQWLTWRAAWWKDAAGRRNNVGLELQEGLYAYASRQSLLLLDMREEFSKLWKKTDAITDAATVEAEGQKKKD